MGVNGTRSSVGDVGQGKVVLEVGFGKVGFSGEGMEGWVVGGSGVVGNGSAWGTGVRDD